MVQMEGPGTTDYHRPTRFNIKISDTHFSKQSPSPYSHRQARESKITSSTQGASHIKGGEQITKHQTGLQQYSRISYHHSNSDARPTRIPINTSRTRINAVASSYTRLQSVSATRCNIKGGKKNEENCFKRCLCRDISKGD